MSWNNFLFGFFFLFIVMPVQAWAGYFAGITRLTAETSSSFDIFIWYPSKESENGVQAGPYRIAARRDALAAEGRFPVILLSHGSGGTPLGHRDLASHLARAGYVVIAPLHVGDSAGRTERRESGDALVDRPEQARKAMDIVLAHPRFEARIDATRIGMIGFSAGGYTGLVLAGGTPDFSQWPAYCAKAADNRDLCNGVTSTRFPGMATQGWQPPRQAGIRAMVLMAPLAVPFADSGLAGIDTPVLLYEALKDTIVPRAANGDKIAQAKIPDLKRKAVPGGHFVFVEPCPEPLSVELPAVCADAKGVDREALHRDLKTEITAFFREQLGR